MPARSQQEQPRPDSTPLSRAGGGESSPAVEQRAGGRRARAAMLLRSSSGLCKKHPPCLQSRVYSAIKRAYWVVHDAATTLFLALQAKLDLCFSKILPVLWRYCCQASQAWTFPVFPIGGVKIDAPRDQPKALFSTIKPTRRRRQNVTFGIEYKTFIP